MTGMNLQAWQNFYIVVGSAGAALTGLQFIVITLVASRPMPRDEASLAAFGTPQIVHFCAALLVSLFACAPWPSLTGFEIAVAVSGGLGVLYVILVHVRARRQTGYEPVLEDWLWHNIFPLAAYAAMVVAALMLPVRDTSPLFVIAAAAVLLLFIGIHNAWDTVIYLLLHENE